MKRTLVFTAAAALAIVPAVVGLTANPSLSREVPVAVPSQAPTADDRGGATDRDLRTEAGDDRRANGTGATTSPTDDATPSGPSSPTAVPDDHGGSTDRDDRFEPGDDRRVNGTAPVAPAAPAAPAAPGAPAVPAPAPADDSGHHGGSSGTDDSGHHASGSDDSGHHGSDDSGSSGGDDSGGRHGGHGSDD